MGEILNKIYFQLILLAILILRKKRVFIFLPNKSAYFRRLGYSKDKINMYNWLSIHTILTHLKFKKKIDMTLKGFDSATNPPILWNWKSYFSQLFSFSQCEVVGDNVPVKTSSVHVDKCLRESTNCFKHTTMTQT